ncbi:MAG: 50S ribosomal protein L6 [Candidatus Pacearchaeota archaeon]|nr:MAG: 50S ribosomal protein L6 [Candidatus Pacearchaeota archaeon]
MKKKITKIIKIPEKTEIKLELPKIVVSGPLGSIEKKFKFKRIQIKKENNEMIIEHEKATKKDKKIINTMASLVESMIRGVNEGYEYKLQICSTHFPISVKIDKEKNLLVIKNFLGENKDRIVRLLPEVDIKIQGDIISINSVNKELAGQQAADIEVVSRIKRRDRRVFQDGIWIIKKEKGRPKSK